MKVGTTVLFQNGDWQHSDTDAPAGASDMSVYARDIALADLAEPLGYDSIWSVEHHFTGYTMVPDVLQFLAYMAGRTKRVGLGTMVVVLPWHTPARIAGAISMLDNLSGGRYTLGIGRGLGRVEFEGFDVPMDESRGRFVEAAEMVLEGLERGYVEYDGQYYKQPKRWIRPAPVRTFRGRSYASAVSPESLDIMARLGVGLLVNPQKPWETIIEETKTYNEAYERINGEPAPVPVVVNHVFCDEDPGRAREFGQRYIGEYYGSVIRHYEIDGHHFAKTSGYEYYEKTAAQLQKRSHDDAKLFYADLQTYGTPEQCLEKIAYIQEEIGCCEYLAIFSYSGMSLEESTRNMRLFAEKVMPRARRLDAPSAHAAVVG